MARAGRPESICGLGATLGEGPVWLAGDDALWLVDIKQARIHRFDPAAAALRSWEAPAPVGWVMPAADGLMLAGLKTGVHLFDPTRGSFTPLVDPEPGRPGNRLNDAATDPAGRLWFGTMDDGEAEPAGRLYRLDGGRAVDSGLPPVTITNGPAFSPDGGTLYHTDTLGRIIWRVPVAADGVTLGRPTVFARIEDDAGYPDGPTVDAEGCVWTGLFGGWAVRRYDPDGRLMRTIPFPVANITKIAFGGEGLRTAYATTARKGLDAAALASQPFAGDIFAFEPDVAGLPVVPAII
ncbi:SMP-30/gluconolactonase/LRE family protein [Sphingomonas quercus]|uniref:SMP-30/gluconolactonase/LRE family protein n=1 Tax=Sphingomonas quercus TaxID=2842451 RepID=A0ABS6BI05_9SPHN|nr:SMP-30/gluconolactonase/LRE family protein [Sphingomonas quercus]MBU3077939.1 SMP-30/gluconolactonase/LRE family protein [Sphingomonas quercus]